jgi:hypothetical protein
MFGRVNQRVINTSPAMSSDTPGMMKMRLINTIPTHNNINTLANKIDLVNVEAVKSTNTMKWGKPTWYLLHTLAEKVKDENFPSVRKDLLDIIYSICTNLPCPDCANHARVYLDGINFNIIQTKEDLKLMLFIFHNTVNKKKGYAIFTQEELDSMYASAITINIIQNFMAAYLVKNSAPQMIANDMFRRRIIGNAQDWLTKNMEKFLP